MRVVRVLFALLLVGIAGCQQAPQAPPPAAPLPGPSPKAYGTLAEVMRGIPFPNSNIILDTQTNDPAAKKPADTKGGAATVVYANTYGGWQQVENAARALSEAVNLIIIPGRKCENGLPVPLDQANFRKFAQGLADAGEATYKAAKSKNLDAMVEVSGTISDACLACHEKYRDVPEGKMRCVPVP